MQQKKFCTSIFQMYFYQNIGRSATPFLAKLGLDFVKFGIHPFKTLAMMPSGNESGHQCAPPILIIIVPLLPIGSFAQAIFHIKTKRK